MYTRFAKVLLALGIADVGYLNLALGPELFIAGERIGDEPSTTRAALREGEAYRTRPTPEARSGASVVADAPQMAPATPAAPPEQAIAEPSGAGGTDAPDDAAERAGEVIVTFPETAAATLTDEARAELLAVAEQLREHPDLRLRVVGHADARGSQRFNRYLGARRARAVSDALLAAGVARRQIQTISRGEDDPRVEGEDERAWAQNRRVEIRLESEERK